MGAQQILDAILAEARRDSEALLAEAGATAAAATEKTIENAKVRAGVMLEKTKSAAQEAARRDRLSAELAARRDGLAKRRALLDRAFEQALDRLCALNDTQYGDLVMSLVIGAAKGTEKLQVSKDEQERYVGKGALLDRMNEALKKAGKPGELTLDDSAGSFRGGAKLIGATIDIDCTFEALIDNYRDDHEAEIAALLFQAKEN